MPRNKFTLLAIVLLTSSQLFSQTRTQTEVLQKAGAQRAAKERSGYEQLKKLAELKKWPLTLKSKNGGIAILTGTNSFGNPVYLTTESNTIAAATIGTNKLWEGGSLGLNLSGSSNAVKNKMALWDGGSVLATHVELTGRITNKDNTANSDHATHVAGTMMATGINPIAKGMAYKMQAMDAYDFNFHISEMLTASTGLLVSNHSYGEKAGWVFNETDNRWEFWGPYNMDEDPTFGMYTSETQIWDSIAYNAPYYLIVKSSGNNRDENGPEVGKPYYRFNSSNVMASAGNRPASLKSNDSYDIIPSYGTAKNILTVGAVNPLAQGYSVPSDVVMSSFSSWGPTDDGRIKPDVVADGVNLTSSIASSNNAYATFSGTSMASPNVTGSLILLQEYYQQLHPGTFMRSATLKGLVIHTADEAGPADGPDYQNGWGLVNVAKAAVVIKDDNSPAKNQVIKENTLNNGDTYTFTVIASGTGPLVATICWTDPKGAITPDNTLNDATPKLVHDLDLRITDAGNTYMPWKLDPTNNTTRAKAATKGDNILDNVEKIEIPNPIPGKTYTIKVTHKGTLVRGTQAYSLIISGVGGAAACTNSAPADANGARINGIKLNNLNFTAASTTTCTQYVDNTTSVANVETNTTYSTNLTIGTCGGENLPSIAFKIFADINSNGSFEAGELLYTSTATTPGTPTYTATFNLPIPAVTVGQSILTRIVLVETNNASAISSCGSYGKGETHDFLLKVIRPSKDVSISEIISPANEDCASGPQNVSVRIRNTGSTDQTNIPLSFKIMKGTTTVLNTTATYPGVVRAAGDAVYTLPDKFTPEAGASYQVESETTLSNDQDQSNNKNTTTLSIAQATEAPTGAAAEICGTSVNFKATPANNDIYFWYDAANATTPIAAGTKTSSNVITANKKYYIDKNNSTIHAGPATNGTLSTTGAYRPNIFYYTAFNNTAPVLIQSAKLYIGKTNTSGKATVMVARNITLSTNSNGQTSISYIPEVATEIDLYVTNPNPSSTAYNANDQGAVFTLNLPVTTTGDHGILIVQDNSELVDATFFGNTNLTTNPYPTGIPGVFTITGNINAQLPSKDPEKYYYVFYDMSVRYINCPSSGKNEVTATTATAPVITIAGNILTSSAATGNQWYKDGTIQIGQTGQTFTANSSGVYTSVVTSSSGCALPSNEITYTVTSVPNVDPAAIGLKILPNPSDGRFVADFTVTRKADLNISILNTIGQKVHEVNYPGFIGRFNKTIEAGNLTTGVYMLRIQHDNKSYLTKLIIR